MPIVPRRAVVVAAAAALAACGSVADPAPASVPSLSHASGALAAVSGGGHFVDQGELRTFTINAVRHHDGRVGGSLVVQNRVLDTRLHADVECLTTIGRDAYLTARITQATDPSWIGEVWLVTARDNGEGAGAPPDQVSRVVQPINPGVIAGWCAGQFPNALERFDVEAGNIQVR